MELAEMERNEVAMVELAALRTKAGLAGMDETITVVLAAQKILAEPVQVGQAELAVLNTKVGRAEVDENTTAVLTVLKTRTGENRLAEQGNNRKVSEGQGYTREPPANMENTRMEPAVQKTKAELAEVDENTTLVLAAQKTMAEAVDMGEAMPL
ncbi:hypothetical protein Q8A67_019103 [Cirrhinus molitorella]|uniref:Uncharacterized protein n=1 Tax=Cirrhinus molitorella TaxID=172907 RepID=A0AA88PD76_9TELE|nr:hypothetical protein Q8A67_019103 [Cirrhinus molitorella]